MVSKNELDTYQTHIDVVTTLGDIQSHKKLTASLSIFFHPLEIFLCPSVMHLVSNEMVHSFNKIMLNTKLNN